MQSRGGSILVPPPTLLGIPCSSQDLEQLGSGQAPSHSGWNMLDYFAGLRVTGDIRRYKNISTRLAFTSGQAAVLTR
jgi:hypothetical protein